MKYQANPVIVEAFQILDVESIGDDGDYSCALGNGNNTKFIATAEMCSRYIPKPGDYWVIQEDGYVYITPKAVFERKYSRVKSDVMS